MKTILITLATVCLTIYAKAQELAIPSISVSYFGETVTHPGFRLGIDYEVLSLSKTKERANGATKTIAKSLIFRPSFGMYHHRHYQTGIFLLPEVAWSRQNEKGGLFSFGLGMGYLRTQVPHVYALDASNELTHQSVGYNHFLTSLHCSFGKDLQKQLNLPLQYFIKPQVMYALPTPLRGTAYFATELGVRYQLE